MVGTHQLQFTGVGCVKFIFVRAEIATYNPMWIAMFHQSLFEFQLNCLSLLLIFSGTYGIASPAPCL